MGYTAAAGLGKYDECTVFIANQFMYQGGSCMCRCDYQEGKGACESWRGLEVGPSAQVTIYSHMEKIIRWFVQHRAVNQTVLCFQEDPQGQGGNAGKLY